MGTVIDWKLAATLAGVVAGEAPHRARPELPGLVAESRELVSAYTGLTPAGDLPAPELVGREAWVQANLASTRPVLDPVMERVGANAGPLAPALRAGAGMLVGAELGAVLGYVSRRVLGQYELVLLDAEGPARLLFVGPNLDEAARTMEVDDAEFVTWVALHEVTHALQFTGVPWLREHLGGLLRGLLGSLEVSVDPARLLRLPSREDLEGFAEAVRGGDLLSLVAGPEQREALDRIQATMAVLEGHAEHVMDAVGAQRLSSLPRLRAAMVRRRTSQSAPARLLTRLLGLDLKLRQYEQGKRFCDAVVQAGGIAALNRVWAGPQALPTVAELDDPAGWLRRTGVPSVTKL